MNILLIDDDDGVAGSFVPLIQGMGHSVEWTKHGDIPEGFKPDVVICDYDLGMFDRRNGSQIVTELRPEAPDARWIIWSGLPREVPDGVEFFSKMDTIELLDSFGEPK